MFKKSFKRFIVPAIVGVSLLSSASLYAGPADQSGPRVFRDQIDMFYVVVANGMIAFVGLDVPRACGDGEFSPDAVWNRQRVVNPSEIELWNAKVDDAVTYVYPISYALDEDNNFNVFLICGHVWAGDDEIASGTSDGILTDNDANAYGQKRTNSYGVSFHGVLDTPTGDPVVFNGGFHCTVRPGSDMKCKDRLNLTD